MLKVKKINAKINVDLNDEDVRDDFVLNIIEPSISDIACDEIRSNILFSFEKYGYDRIRDDIGDAMDKKFESDESDLGYEINIMNHYYTVRELLEKCNEYDDLLEDFTDDYLRGYYIAEIEYNGGVVYFVTSYSEDELIDGIEDDWEMNKVFKTDNYACYFEFDIEEDKRHIMNMMGIEIVGRRKESLKPFVISDNFYELDYDITSGKMMVGLLETKNVVATYEGFSIPTKIDITPSTVLTIYHNGTPICEWSDLLSDYPSRMLSAATSLLMLSMDQK